MAYDAVQKRFAELADMLMAISECRPEFPNRRNDYQAGQTD